MTKIIGYARGKVPIYNNSNYYSKNNISHYGMKNSKYEGIFYGLKFQCLEFVRRWYIHQLNVSFDNIINASKIFKLKYAIDLTTNEKIPFQHIINDGLAMPQIGDIIVFKNEGEYSTTGHVAIMNKPIKKSIIQIAEQNGKTQNGLRNIDAHDSIIYCWMRLHKI